MTPGNHRPLHAVSAAEALAALGARPEGLTDAEAEERRAQYGPNELPRQRAPGPIRIFVRQFENPLIYLLLAAAAVSAAIGEALDATFIGAVLLLNAAIGTSQEWRAAKGAAALDRLVRQTATVRRAGRRRTVDGAELVPGDTVEVESGMRAPADLRLLESRELSVDESLLTGESTSVGKDASAAVAHDAALGDRITMLHAGSTVLAGRGLGVVAATAAATELGRIAGALAASAAPPPPIVLRLERFTRVLGASIVGAVAALASIELARGADAAEVFFVAVALAVSAIPEGLPIAVSVTLAVAAGRMARRNVIVRLLPAVEGLGACTAIASDKTGTLTMNELTAKAVTLPGGRRLDVGGQGYVAAGEIEWPEGADRAATRAAMRELAETLALCNEASWRMEYDGSPAYVGDTVDVAFLVLAAKAGVDGEALARERPGVATIPFEPHRRYAARFEIVGGRPLVHVKGAAETVLPMCADVDVGAVAASAAAMAREGYRVIAAAAGPTEGTRAQDLRGLRFLGLVGLIDPVRPEVPDAIARCRRAGIEVVMVTGDHPETALAIGRRLGLADDAATVATGRDLDAADDPDRFDLLVARTRIFARVEPRQKLRIVESLRRAGHFVAVTGDGVNDAPALQEAHIGVAMGRGGTDVARSAGDLILTDDNFASIVAGIEQGRIAYDNVRKVVLMLVATGAAEIALFFLALAAGLPLPLGAAQLLWLNLVTNGVQDMALAVERGEPNVLLRKPRPPREPLFDRRMIAATVVWGGAMGSIAFAAFAAMLSSGLGEAEARNVLLLLMVSLENALTLSCRSESRSIFSLSLQANPFVVWGVAGAQVLHIAAMHAPGLSDVLEVAPVSPAIWAQTVAAAAALVLVVELHKAIRRRARV